MSSAPICGYNSLSSFFLKWDWVLKCIPNAVWCAQHQINNTLRHKEIICVLIQKKQNVNRREERKCHGILHENKENVAHFKLNSRFRLTFSYQAFPRVYFVNRMSQQEFFQKKKKIWIPWIRFEISKEQKKRLKLIVFLRMAKNWQTRQKLTVWIEFFPAVFGHSAARKSKKHE